MADKPGPNFELKIPGFRPRKATVADIPAIEAIASQYYFDLGIENTRLYFEASPDTWFVIENENGEVVAYDSYNKLPGNCYLGYQLAVRKDNWGRGLTRLTYGMENRSYPILGNSTKFSIERYNLVNFGPKIVGRVTRVTDPAIFVTDFNLPQDCTIVPVGPNNIEQVLDYDESVLGMNRRWFMRRWLLDQTANDGNRPLVAVRPSNGRVRGIASFRRLIAHTPYWYPCPLYANDEAVAEALLRSVCAQTKAGDIVHIHTMANCRMALRFAAHFGFIDGGAEFRTYSCEVAQAVHRAVDWTRVYAIHEYYPA